MICNNLDEVRSNIDRIDDEIIRLIAERGTYVSQASKFKKNEDGVRDNARVEKVIEKVRTKATNFGANPDMVEKLYREMISGFIKMEMKEFRSANNLTDPAILRANIDKIHSTPLGVERIKKNLKLKDTEVISYCKKQITSPDCHITLEGKNWYCSTANGIVITINSKSYTIITAHFA